MTAIILSLVVSAQTVPPQVEQQAAVIAAKNAPKIARHLKPRHNPLKLKTSESHLISTTAFKDLEKVNPSTLDLQKYRLVDASRYFTAAGLKQYEKRIMNSPSVLQHRDALSQALQKADRLKNGETVIGIFAVAHEIFFAPSAPVGTSK